MKCERCGCEIDGLAWSLSEYEKGTTTNTHLTSDNCIKALRRQLDALQPKPERFAVIRRVTSMKFGMDGDIDVTKELREVLQAFDEAVAIDTVERWQTWHDKWGNK